MECDTTSGVILVVEDPFIRKYVRRILETRHAAVVEAEPRHGVDIVSSGRQKIRLVITNNPALFAACAPGIPLLYTAMLPDADLVAPFHSARVLRKPFGPEDLLRAVEALSPTPA